MSISIKSGCSDRARVSPDSASVALNTVWPADFSRKVASVMLAGLSSTTSTFPTLHHRDPVGDSAASSHSAPNFTDEVITVEVGLFHYRRHISIEVLPVLGCEVFRRNYEDRDASGFRVLDQRRDDVEATDFGHHQVEHDQVGEFPARGVDCLLAAVRT